jgi:molybdenum cofactor biosynthesis enzyme MoaA
MVKRSPEQLAGAIKRGDSDLYFCPLLFSHLYSDNAGRWRLCCRAAPFGDDYSVRNVSPHEHWTRPQMQQIRREMLCGELDLTRQHCRKCLEIEEAGRKSPRDMLNRKLLARGEPADIPVLREASRASAQGEYALTERCLELKLRVFGNYCNLACYMCAPVNSTTRLKELRQIRDGYWLREMTVPDRPDFFESEEGYERFIGGVLELLPYVKKIKITGGEPFLLRRHHEFLRQVVRTPHARRIRLSYDTNMTKFQLGSSNVLSYLEKFHGVTLSVSVDDLGERNDYIRYGAKFEEVIASIEVARRYPNIKVDVSCATGMLNAGDVHDVAAFFDARRLEAKFNMCVITKPLFVQARHLPDPLKAEYLARIERSPFRERFTSVAHMLGESRDEAQFQTFLRYAADLDALRGTSLFALWPELKPFAAP